MVRASTSQRQDVDESVRRDRRREALRLKEAGKRAKCCVSIGPAQAAETIRTGLAMGADRGSLVKADGVLSLWPSRNPQSHANEEHRPDHSGQAGDR